MKTLRLVIWGVIAAVLICVLVLGLTGHINILGFFSINGSTWYPNSELYSVGGGSASVSEVSAVELNWTAGDVTIRPYGGEDIKFSETSSYDINRDEEMRYLIKNGKLTIQYCAPGIRNAPNKSLTVYVPEDYAPDEIIIDAVSASIDAESISADKIILEAVSGSITASGIKSGAISLETVSGSIDASDCIADKLTTESVSGSTGVEGEFIAINSESVSGSITVSPGKAVLEVSAETVSGGVRVELSENAGFTVVYDSISGDFSCDFPVITNKNKAVCGDGEMLIKLETISGNIKITMK